MPKEFSRSRRVGHLLQQEIAAILPEVRDVRAGQGILPTISGVDLSPDMKSARIFFSVMTGPEHAEDVRQALQNASGYIRHQLGRRLDLRRIPNLVFAYDTSFDEGAHMSRLLHDARRMSDQDEVDE
ncbi:30S ribosome-binding factor RbfA [Thermithiobacillus plumbiphilus]|uniref:Ribosome-binding factor A n=1 Tax=Thermithiobacillus plumbiphilus TaxID=1729899 RepID=A0ABU9D4P3_9PROT